jgi:2'-5' RNA ligase
MTEYFVGIELQDQRFLEQQFTVLRERSLRNCNIPIEHGRSPFHVTLIPPVSLDEKLADSLFSHLIVTARLIRRFPITFGAPFNFWDGSGTVAWPVSCEGDALRHLYDALLSAGEEFFPGIMRRSFGEWTPHVSIARHLKTESQLACVFTMMEGLSAPRKDEVTEVVVYGLEDQGWQSVLRCPLNT